MDTGLLAVAVTAGMLAVVNPCGFAMLPAYLSLLLTGDQPGPAALPLRRVGRALAVAGAMTAGFVAVFGAFGLLVAPAAGTVHRYLPWLTVLLGAGLVLMGGWLLAGRQLPVPAALKISRAPRLTGSLASMALFGAAYAAASVSCTIGPFLAIVVASLRTGQPLAGVLLFAGYAAGMGLVTGSVAVAVALARTGLVHRVRAATRRTSRAGGLLLVLAGGYVGYYGWYDRRALAGGGPDPLIEAGGRVQRWLAGGLERLGAPVLATLLAGLLLAAGTTALLARRRADGGTALPAGRRADGGGVRRGHTGRGVGLRDADAAATDPAGAPPEAGARSPV